MGKPIKLVGVSPEAKRMGNVIGIFILLIASYRIGSAGLIIPPTDRETAES